MWPFLSYGGNFPCSSGMLLARQFLKSAQTSPSQVLFNYVDSWILSSAILKCGVYFSWGIFSVVCNYGNKTFLGRVTKSIFDVRDDLVMYFFYLFPFFFCVCMFVLQLGVARFFFFVASVTSLLLGSA